MTVEFRDFAHAQTHGSADFMWTCPKCGQSIEDKFDACWHCAADPDTPDAVNRLDREWEIEREKHIARDSEDGFDGLEGPPTSRGAIYGTVCLVGLGSVVSLWLWLASEPTWWIGIPIVIAGLLVGLDLFLATKRYEKALSSYLFRRFMLLFNARRDKPITDDKHDR